MLLPITYADKYCNNQLHLLHWLIAFAPLALPSLTASSIVRVYVLMLACWLYSISHFLVLHAAVKYIVHRFLTN